MINRKTGFAAVVLAAVLSIGAMAESAYVYEDDNLKLGTYTGLTYSAVLKEVTEEDIQQEIDDTLQFYAESEHLMEGTAAEGDTVNVDYKGTVDGEAFDGGTDTDTELTLGSGMFLEEFEKGVIGMKPGETKDVPVTFPEDYFSEELAGKEASFAITLNYICGEEIIPEFTDEFVSENFEVSGTEEYLENVRKQLEEDAETAFEEERETQVMEALNAAYEVSEVDEELVKKDVDSAVETYKSYAAMYGMEYEDFLSQYGIDAAAFEEELSTSARAFEGQKLALKKIAELEGIEASDEDVEAYLAETAEQYNYESVEALKTEMTEQGFDPIEDMREDVLMNKVRQWLIEHAVYVEAPEAEEAEAVEEEAADEAEAAEEVTEAETAEEGTETEAAEEQTEEAAGEETADDEAEAAAQTETAETEAAESEETAEAE